MSNPLLSNDIFPHFSAIKPMHVLRALRQVLRQNRATLKRILKQPKRDWQHIMVPLAKMDQALHQMWAPVSHLNAVNHSDALQKVYEKALVLLTDYGNELSHHEGLYQAFCAISERPDFKQLSVARQTVIEHALRDFRLAGVHLSMVKKTKIKQHYHQLSALSQQFSSYLLAATNAWTMHAEDRQLLDGLPETAMQTAAALAKSQKKSGYMLTLQMPSYLAVMGHAKDRALRATMYHAHSTRASDCGPYAKRWDNAKVMQSMLKHRAQLAKVLGFESYADYALQTRMAKDPAQVIRFIRGLIRKAKPKAKKDFKALQQFAKESCGIDKLQPWDMAYVADCYRQHHFAYSQEDLRPYFQESQVLQGLFAVVKRLYGMDIKAYRGAQRCDPLAKVFKVTDQKGELRGYLMMDLYARSSKRGGAWMDECQQRYRDDQGVVQPPVAHIVANFNPPVGRRAAQLTHDDVVTIFHEVGHALHHVLTQVDEADVSGINGVPWDAVECPSQLLENWAWEPKVLRDMSKHIKTKRHLPPSLIKTMLASKQFMSGMHVLRQCELALFDMLMHHDPKPYAKAFIRETLANIRSQTGLLPAHPDSRFENSFSHVFAGGYSAGYYSYLWAELLSADAFAYFKTQGVYSRKVGQSFLEHVLSKGGSEPFMDLYKRFRGRAPKVDALLADYGIGRR